MARARTTTRPHRQTRKMAARRSVTRRQRAAHKVRSARSHSQAEPREPPRTMSRPRKQERKSRRPEARARTTFLPGARRRKYYPRLIKTKRAYHAARRFALARSARLQRVLRGWRHAALSNEGIFESQKPTSQVAFKKRRPRCS